MTATPDQARLAQEVLDGTREVTGSATVAPPEPEPLPASLSGLPEDAKQQLYDVRASLSTEIAAAESFGQTSAQVRDTDLEFKQWTFERGEVAQDIQRTQEIRAPGE